MRRFDLRVRRLTLLLMTGIILSACPAAGQPISDDGAAKWRADLTFAADSLPRAHPNFFHQMSRETYRVRLDALAARLPGMAQHEVVVALAEIVVGVGDGHTRVTFPFDRSAGFFTGHATTAAPKIPGLVFRHYPVRFGLFGDSLCVTHATAADRALLGGRVVRLGERTAGEAMAAVEPVVQRDNESQVRNLLPSWLVCPEILAARGVVPDRERLRIEVEAPGGGRVVRTLAPVAPGTAVTWIDARVPGPEPRCEQHPERAHWFETIPGTSVVYARYREVRDDDGESVAQFADSLLAAFEAAGAKRLVLDLRGNVGATACSTDR